jgi:hypothetical protein
LKNLAALKKCEEWRKRGQVNSEQMTDIFDGQLWKDFQKYNGSDFLNAPRTLFSFA